MSIIKSDDNKLFNFSIDEKTGGTYRSRISLMHYSEIDTKNLPNEKEISENIKTNPYLVFEGNGFNEIYTVPTKEGIKYLLIGDVRGCSYCFETHVMLVKFDAGLFKCEFYYSVNSRSWETGVKYNSKTKTITVDYETDDLTPECGCLNNSEDEIITDYDAEPIRQKCHCEFGFNGLNFELLKEHRETIKE